MASLQEIMPVWYVYNLFIHAFALPGGAFLLDKVYTIVYTFPEVMTMDTAKLFMNGKSQAVRLPKEYRLPGDEVYIQKVGSSVMLVPKKNPEDIDSAWEAFLKAPPVSDDFVEAIWEARRNDYQPPREPL